MDSINAGNASIQSAGLLKFDKAGSESRLNLLGYIAVLLEKRHFLDGMILTQDTAEKPQALRLARKGGQLRIIPIKT